MTFLDGGSLISNKTTLACRKDIFKVLQTNNFTLFYYFPSAFHVFIFYHTTRLIKCTACHVEYILLEPQATFRCKMLTELACKQADFSSIARKYRCVTFWECKSETSCLLSKIHQLTDREGNSINIHGSSFASHWLSIVMRPHNFSKQRFSLVAVSSIIGHLSYSGGKLTAWERHPSE